MVHNMDFKAVIFDLGGVVLGSPLAVITEYEQELEIPSGSINRVVAATGPAGAWSRLECGAISMSEFYEAFDRDCADGGFSISARTLMRRIGTVTKPRPVMIEALSRLRRSTLLVAALTNNWKNDRDGTGAIKSHFDRFFESSVLGMQKPDPRIYQHVCEAMDVSGQEAVFLDDIGRNLKAARALGFTTIKVEDPTVALRELGSTVGLELVD